MDQAIKNGNEKFVLSVLQDSVKVDLIKQNEFILSCFLSGLLGELTMAVHSES